VNWQVYVIRCSDGTLYTGISTDVERRCRQHQSLRGARYFRGRAPVALVYLESGHDRGSASRREAAIKKLRRTDKLSLIASDRNELAANGDGVSVADACGVPTAC
jgi:putative endonuclease